jgi:hypothetical protein
MCFSATADLVGGGVVAVLGVDVIRHLDHRRRYLALGALPLLLAAHQIDEAFVWWGLQGHVAPAIGHVATWIYLLFAFVVLPVYVPAAIWAIEPPGRRRLTMLPFVALGAVVSIVLLAAMLGGPVTASLGHLHVSYATGLHAGGLVVAAYVVATCGALVASGYRPIALFGLVQLAAVGLLAHLEVGGFASLWCGWAAVSSGVLVLFFRFGGPHRSVAALAV